MIASKNHSGFTLIETLAALAIFALVSTPVFLLENAVSQRVAKSSRQAEMVLEGKKFLYDARIKWQKQGREPQPTEITVAGKRLKMRYVPKKIESASSLKSIYGLYHERVMLTWTDAQGKQTDELVSYLMVPPVEKEGP